MGVIQGDWLSQLTAQVRVEDTKNPCLSPIINNKSDIPEPIQGDEVLKSLQVDLTQVCYYLGSQ